MLLGYRCKDGALDLCNHRGLNAEWISSSHNDPTSQERTTQTTTGTKRTRMERKSQIIQPTNAQAVARVRGSAFTFIKR
jgi:hypothetical protein